GNRASQFLLRVLLPFPESFPPSLRAEYKEPALPRQAFRAIRTASSQVQQTRSSSRPDASPIRRHKQLRSTREEQSKQRRCTYLPASATPANGNSAPAASTSPAQPRLDTT